MIEQEPILFGVVLDHSAVEARGGHVVERDANVVDTSEF
jgi:hypothetical protein